jgi:thiol-disulfide isomerase/thioredoxin
MNQHQLIVILACVLPWLAACCACGQPPRRDAEAVQLLEQAKAFYAALPSWQADVRSFCVLEDRKTGALSARPGCTGTYAVRRPNAFAIRYPDEPGGCTTLIGDGTRVWTYVHLPIEGGRRHSEGAAAPGFGSLERPSIMNIEDAMVAQSVMRWLPSGALFDEVLENPRRAILMLPHDPQRPDERTVRVVLTESVMDYTFSAGERPWMLRVSEDYDAWIEMRRQEGASLPARPLRGSDTVEFSNWSTEIDPRGFEFEPPEGSRRMDNVIADLLASAMKKIPPHALEDKPAPEASVVELGGERRSLREVRGDGVLVVDFWATWCGPCVASFPLVEKTVDAFHGRGVRLLAVNVREDEGTVRGFLAKRGWTAPVALDPDGSASAAFGVRAIPMTVVIDRRGVVSAVLGGALPDIEDRLKAAIEATLR